MPKILPINEKIIPEIEKESAPQSEGISPPTVPPKNNPIQIYFFISLSATGLPLF